MNIRKRARELYGRGYLARKWARAVCYLRREKKWVLDGAHVGWRAR